MVGKMSIVLLFRSPPTNTHKKTLSLDDILRERGVEVAVVNLYFVFYRREPHNAHMNTSSLTAQDKNRR